MCDCIPLEHDKELDVPDSSTLFRPIQTQLYYCQDQSKNFDEAVLKYLRAMSEKVAEQKNLIVQHTWHYFFDQVLADITRHDLLQEELFNTETEFFDEDVPYSGINHPSTRSNKIRYYLHEILTYAIFNYSPSKDLVWNCHKNHIPNFEEWKACNNIWVGLSAEPFQNVSKFNFIFFT